MKLATLKDGRDGRLVVVSQDLKRQLDASAVTGTLQSALDDWSNTKPRLEELAATVESEGEAFDQSACASPLPRAYQWADGSAYVNHVELVRKARGAEMPESFWTEPLMYQGGSDTFLAPRDDIQMADEAWGIDFEAEVAVITDDVPMGVSAENAGNYIRLIMLVNDVSLRGLIPGELGKGFGFFQSKPSSAFSPVAVTPDELGDAWHDNKVHLPLLSNFNDAPFGKPEAGIDMTFADRFARTAVKFVRHGAGTDDRAGGEWSRFRRMRNQLSEIEGHVDARFGFAKGGVIEIRQQRKMQLVVVPSVTEFIRCHGDR